MPSGDITRNCVLLTGLPRSGTTLTCHLLNKLPDTIALHEPMHATELGRIPDWPGRLQAVRDFLRQTRLSLLQHGDAVSKHANGVVPDNSRASEWSAGGRRKSIATRGTIHFDKRLSDDFQLVVKHPSSFCAMLEHLTREFRCFAVVRNPLSVLASWNTVDMAVRNGHVPAAEVVDAALASRLAALSDRFDRQFVVLNWFYDCFAHNLSDSSIIRYENMTESGGRALAVINPAAAALNETLESRNRSALYDAGLIRDLGERLLRSDGVYWKFYSRDDVGRVMENNPGAPVPSTPGRSGP